MIAHSVKTPIKHIRRYLKHIFFDHHFITGCTLNTTPPSDARLKTHRTPKNHIPRTPFTHSTCAPVWVPIPAWRQLFRPITVGSIGPVTRTPPVPATAAPRARITSIFSGSSLYQDSTGTGIGTHSCRDSNPDDRYQYIPVERKILWQRRPTLQPQDLRSQLQPQNCQSLPVRLPQSARLCCPVRATSGRTTTGKPSLHGTPEEKGQAHAPKAGAKAA